MKRYITLILCVITLCCYADDKFVGGDISLLPSYVSHGADYYDPNGNAINSPLAYFGEQGMNAMRVRLFVNPANASATHKGEGVCQDLEYVKALGKQIKDAGMALMLDFHYSDTWADPAKQWTPKEWLSLSDDDLYEKIYSYTKEVLEEMKAAGATPDFIQTGNEISYGMLWGAENGSSLKKCYVNNESNWPRFTTLLKKAASACREVCPQARIIIHTERVAQGNVLKQFYNKMKSYDVDYDIIGLSYYPYYHGTLQTLNSVLTDMENSFPDKKIMIVETGYFHHWQPSNESYDLSGTYPISPEGQKAFPEALINILHDHAHVCGLFWWMMEANEKGLDWNTQRVTDNWYNAGLFDNETGKAMPAITILKNFLKEGAGIHNLSADISRPSTLYTIDGRSTGQQSINNLPAGIYIQNGKKIMK
jgi:arabinogalactan endo-1,4-beta-galactosidase